MLGTCIIYLAAGTLALQYPISMSAAANLLDLRLPSPRGDVRAAYRKKAATAHPDMRGVDSAAEFLRITAAYELLLQCCPQTIHTGRREAAEVPCPTSRPPSASPSRSEASSGSGRDTERMGRRVDAWREFWQVSLRATAAATEAQLKALERDALAADAQRLQHELRAVVALGGGPGTDTLRARYATASVRLADAQCAVRSFETRARAMHQQALKLQTMAQSIF